MEQIATFENKVKEKLLDSIAGLMPEEQISDLVKKQHEHFINTYLPELIKRELTAMYKQILDGQLRTVESYSWINGRIEASEPVKEILTNAAPEIFSQMFGEMMQIQLTNFKNQLNY